VGILALLEDHPCALHYEHLHSNLLPLQSIPSQVDVCDTLKHYINIKLRKTHYTTATICVLAVAAALHTSTLALHCTYQ